MLSEEQFGAYLGCKEDIKAKAAVPQKQLESLQMVQVRLWPGFLLHRLSSMNSFSIYMLESVIEAISLEGPLDVINSCSLSKNKKH